MRKFSLSVLTVLVLLLTTVAFVSPSNTASAAPEVQRVGLVIAYTEGQSITIIDQHGNQFTFELDSHLKIVPPDRAHLLAPGVYVTIIAPNNFHEGKSIATGIVIHPHIPEGFPVPTASFTPLPTDTALPTEVSSETPTALETVEETMTVTETPIGNETPAETATSTEGSPEDTPTPTETPAGTSLPQADTHSAVAALVDWLASIFRQLLSG
jgi:hypothetical protein